MAQSATRQFPLEDVLWFAGIAGDPNPVHIDPAYAARSYPGSVIAHGVHMAVWALDALAAADGWTMAQGLKAVFQRPVVIGEQVQAEVVKAGSIVLKVGDERAASIKLSAGGAPAPWAFGAPLRTPSFPPVLQGPPAPGEEVVGAIVLRDDVEGLSAAFPNLVKTVGQRRLQGLAGLAPLSGGVLGGVTTEFAVQAAEDDSRDVLEYKLLSYHPALQRYELAFFGYGVAGKVAAIVGGREKAAA